jgi:prepilin-type N-terminal cleavage/methylation domain-containing protein
MTRITKVSPDDAGFTLVEMLVVLAIVALLTALVVVPLHRQDGPLARQRSAAELRSKLVSATRDARLRGVMIEVPLTAIKGRSLTVLPEVGMARDHILLHPDQSSTGGVVLLDGQPLLRIDWLTSAIRDVG